MLTKKGSYDLVVNTQSTLHPWGVHQTRILPIIVNKLLKVNTSGFVMSTSHSEPKVGYINASNSRAGHRHIVLNELLELKRSDPTESRLCVTRLLICLPLKQFNNSCCQEFPALGWRRGFISVFGLVAAEAATRTTIRTYAIIDWYLAEQQALWGQDYLVNKRSYTDKFKPSERCSPNQTLHLNRVILKLKTTTTANNLSADEEEEEEEDDYDDEDDDEDNDDDDEEEDSLSERSFTCDHEQYSAAVLPRQELGIPHAILSSKTDSLG
ncbi:hypothetical protein DPMN_006074 [Dreissena polymorpha]|uniref:Uncharacterized protein n=1 Tax=Dreissena polymorpha TaxID=45954 RepID=A0A9D4MTF2_DREPO|nr:hypothetical protein DPMN_006074 [Dreissena polymorpha]